MQTYFRARPKDFGAAFVRFGAAIAATANSTNTYGLGGLADKDTTAPVVGHVGYIDELTCAQVTIVADADGTTVLNVYKYDASAAAAVELATDFNLEGQTAGKIDAVPFDAGLTDQQRTLDYGDYLYATVVNDSAAIDTAMVGGSVGALIKLLV